MSGPPRVPARVVLAARASADALRLLDEATTLARALRAELAGLFVEESDLLRLAALPVTREVGVASGAVREIDLAGTTRLLQRQADEVRAIVERAAAGLDLPWSFRITRGNVVQAAVAAAAGPDLVLVAPPRSAAQRALGFLPPAPRAGGVAAFYDGTPSGDRALAAALHLASGFPERVWLVLPARGNPVALSRLAADRLGVPRGLPAAVVLPELRRHPAPRALVVSTTALATGAANLPALLADVRGPVVLVP